jgi:thiamine transport system permease protein
MRSSRPFLLLALLPVGFLAVFFYLPLLSILKEGLLDAPGHLTGEYLLATILDPYNRRVIVFTLHQAVLSTLLTLVLGLPGAYLVAKFDFPGKSVLKAVTTVPFVLPAIIVSLGFILLFGNNGALNRWLMALFHLQEPPLRILYSLKAIVLAHAFYNFPLVVRLVSAVWGSIDPKIEDAARALGATEWRVFRHITLPMIFPGIAASLALTFMFSFMSFAVVLVLGGVKYATIEVNIYMLMTVMLDYKMGSALAIVQSLFSLSFMYFYAKVLDLGSRTERVAVEPKGAKPKLLTGWRGVFTWRGFLLVVYGLIVGGVVIGPLVAVLVFSVLHYQGDQLIFSLKSYYKILTIPYNPILGTTPLRSIQNSVFFGIMTVLFSLPLGVLIAFGLTRKTFPLKNVFDALVMLPLGISSVSLGLGYVRSFHKPPLMITGTWYAIVFAHTIIAYPFVMRAVTPILKKMKPTLVDAAMSLGATRPQAFFLIELPLLKPGIIVGATFAFAISVGELGATYMLYRPHLTTMPISIYRFLAAHDLVGASAMGMILIAVCTLLFLCIEKTGYKTF